MHSPKDKKRWIADFLLREGEKTHCKSVIVSGVNITEAIEAARKRIEEAFPGSPYYIHNAGLTCDWETYEEEIFSDPVGWDMEDLRNWKWE